MFVAKAFPGGRKKNTTTARHILCICGALGGNCIFFQNKPKE